MKNYKFTINGNTYNAEILGIDDNIATLEINGSTYKVEMHREKKISKTPTIVRKVVQNEEPQKIDKKEGSTYPIVAPLPGTIMELSVKEGDILKKGDKILVMEAMKMENDITAEKDCVVEKINTSVGASVLQGDVLLEVV